MIGIVHKTEDMYTWLGIVHKTADMYTWLGIVHKTIDMYTWLTLCTRLKTLHIVQMIAELVHVYN